MLRPSRMASWLDVKLAPRIVQRHLVNDRHGR